MNPDYHTMKTHNTDVDQVAVSIISNVIREKFAGHADFEPLAQFDDLFIFKSSQVLPRVITLNTSNGKRAGLDINERQFELVKPRLKKEIEEATQFKVTHLDFISGKDNTRFLILSLASPGEVEKASLHDILLAN